LLAHAIYDVARFTDGRDSFSPDAFQYYRLRMGLGADLVVEQRYGDFTYDTETGRRMLLENEIETNETVLIDAPGYLSLFDLLFPKLGSFPDTEPIPCQFFLASADYFANVVHASIEPFVVPLTHQQNNYFNPQNETLLNATFRQQSYRIILEPKCFVIYICLSLIILLWGITLLALSGRKAIPVGDELDIINRWITNSEDMSVILESTWTDNKRDKSRRMFETVRVKVVAVNDEPLSNTGGDGVVNIPLQELRLVRQNGEVASVSIYNERRPDQPQHQANNRPVESHPRQPDHAVHLTPSAALPQQPVPDGRIKIILTCSLLPHLAFKCSVVNHILYLLM
jgi:hypothetical protein